MPTRTAAPTRFRRLAAGFSMVELLVASVVGLVVLVAIAEALIAHLRSSARSEALFRQRQDWARAERFIEMEIAHSSRLRSTASSAELTACGLTSDELRLVLEMPGGRAPVLYGVRGRNSSLGTYGSSADWNGTNLLLRCGPGFDTNGDYLAASTAASLSVVVDELTANAAGGGFQATLTGGGSASRSVSFLLSLDGITNPAVRQIGSYLGQSGSSVGLSPPIPFPSSYSLCDQICSGTSCTAPSGTTITTGTPYGETLSSANTLICGLGGGDNISGTTADQAIDPGRTAHATISGGGGRDVLFGSAGNDSITGGSGDDILVGRNGSDTLVGGGGNDLYYPLTDILSTSGGSSSVIRGGSGFDTVYLAGKKASFTVGSCSPSSCVVSSGSGSETKTVTMENVDLLIFEDDRRSTASGS